MQQQLIIPEFMIAITLPQNCPNDVTRTFIRRTYIECTIVIKSKLIAMAFPRGNLNE